MLERGAFNVSPWSNVAPGTMGSIVMRLTERGLMSTSADQVHRLHMMGMAHLVPKFVSAYANHGTLMDTSSRYVVTRAGRDAYVSYGAPYVPITLSEPVSSSERAP